MSEEPRPSQGLAASDDGKSETTAELNNSTNSSSAQPGTMQPIQGGQILASDGDGTANTPVRNASAPVQTSSTKKPVSRHCFSL